MVVSSTPLTTDIGVSMKPGRHRVDQDVVAAELHRHRFGVGDDAALGGVVGAASPLDAKPWIEAMWMIRPCCRSTMCGATSLLPM